MHCYTKSTAKITAKRHVHLFLTFKIALTRYRSRISLGVKELLKSRCQLFNGAIPNTEELRCRKVPQHPR